MATSAETSWGICGVTQRSPAVAQALLPQDCLYSVLERRPMGTKVSVIGAIRDVLVAQDQAEAVTDRLADATTRIVTLTVTEKGYRLALLPVACALTTPRCKPTLPVGRPGPSSASW